MSNRAPLRPVLHPGVFVFCTLPHSEDVPESAVCWIREDEGLSIVLPKDEAIALGLTIGFDAAWITLAAVTELSAVGITAAVSTALADARICCNVVAGFHHDHLFVPFEAGERALALLKKLDADK